MTTLRTSVEVHTKPLSAASGRNDPALVSAWDQERGTAALNPDTLDLHERELARRHRDAEDSDRLAKQLREVFPDV